MDQIPDFLSKPHDPQDPNPWRALYLDRSTPLPDEVKQAWLADSSSSSRQYLLPFLRPLARLMIVLIQIVKTFLPRKWSHSGLLHRILVWGLKRFVSPQANWLILRHFHLGSQVLAFIAANSPTKVPTTPFVTPADLPRRRALRLISDVTCDVTSDTNMLPVNTDITSWDEPVRRLSGTAGPLDVIAIDQVVPSTGSASKPGRTL